MKVAILGAGGQLAYDLQRVMVDMEIVPLRHTDLDVCDHDQVHATLNAIRPDVVINTTAFHRVDDCEVEIEKAFRVNTFAVLNLARVCAELDCLLVHMSTDYVFGDGRSTPFTEDDLPQPLSVYGISKLAGEYAVRSSCRRHIVVRSSGLYGVAGSSGKGGNFVMTMLGLARSAKPIRVVNDQVFSPTYTKDLAEKLVELLPTGAYGVYHFTNSGQCSWYEFAAEIFDLAGLEPSLAPTTSVEYGMAARRPSFSVLVSLALPACGILPLRHWKEALKEYIGACNERA